MPKPGAIRTALAVPAMFALLQSVAWCATLDGLTSELDRAQEPAELAETAFRLEEFVSAKGGTGAAPLTQLARAYYLLGESEPDEDLRLGYLDKALAVSERALFAKPGYPYALYWRSMAWLQKADIVGGLSALGMVKRALRDFEDVESVIPAYDGAGAYRSHGKVLMEAPAWAFIGDKKRGVRLLEKARDIAPDALINRLYLAEAYIKTGRRKEALGELGYIAGAPASPLRPKDDLKIKEDAAGLMEELCR